MDKDLTKKYFELDKFDPLARAEELTNKSYKEDEGTALWGFQMQIRLSNAKKELLESLGDTTFSSESVRYISIIEGFGFELIFKEDFHSESSNETESFYIYFHPQISTLLVFDTYHNNINCSTLYYNYAYKRGTTISSRFGSGTVLTSYFDLATGTTKPYTEKAPRWDYAKQEYSEFKKLFNEWDNKSQEYIIQNNLYQVWSGNFDGREGLITKLTEFINKGIFLTEWIDTPFLWLLHHGNKNTDDHKIINAKVIEQLPENIQKLLTKKFAE